MLQVAKNTNYFDLMGMPRRYQLSTVELEQRYREEARAHHPDRHVNDEARVRVSSALRTAELTAAYRVLKDPVRRAEYLLGLEGIRICDEHAACPATPEFLGQIMELREELAEAHAAGATGRLEELGRDMRARYAKAMISMEAGFARREADENAAAPATAQEIVRALVAIRYYRRFLDELEAYQEAGSSAGAL